MGDQALSPEERLRYARHLTLPGVGEEGQLKLKAAKVLVIGAGGLGSPILNYLGAAGVGHITILDGDVVEESNLQRQTIHRMEDIGRNKAESATDALRRLNPYIAVEGVKTHLTHLNAIELFQAHDLVIDGTDNFATRYLSNDAAELTSTPLVWGTISQFQGQLSVFDPNRGPMLRDLFPEMPPADAVPSCAVGGVFGALPGLVGSMMAIEALKHITGVGEVAVGKLVLLDALTTSMRTLTFTRDPGRAPVEKLQPVDEPVTTTVEPQGTLIDVRNPEETALGVIPGAHLVPLAEIEERGWEAVAPFVQDTTTFYCKSGMRSERAIKLIREHTEAELLNFQGGYVAWSARN